MTKTTEVLTAEQFAEREQEYLWDDFDQAIRYAVNGAWSMAASNYAGRIVWAARVGRVTPSGRVPWRLVAGGIYETLCSVAGLECDLPDEAEWSRLDDLMMGHGGPRAVLSLQMEATRSALRADSEWVASEFH